MGHFDRKFTKRGAPPGAFAPAPASGVVEPIVSVLSFDAQGLDEAIADSPSVAIAFAGQRGVTWIDVRGLGDGSIVRSFGEQLKLHPLAISDVVNVGQRPKVDEYEGYAYAVLRMVTMLPGEDLQWEQISLFVLPGLVLTFQETHQDCFEPLRDRIRMGRPIIRSSGADYLAMMVIDALVDGYFPVLEHYGDRIDSHEERVLVADDQGTAMLRDLYGMKRNLAAFRRAAWPLREALGQLHRGNSPIVTRDARLHLRDTLDHIMQLVEVNESYRELTTSLVDLHLSIVGQKTNDVMRVLTVVSTIFIPLTFIAGVYGMNFDPSQPMNMPELRSPYGYVGFLAVSAATAAVLLVVFRRLGWLGGGK